MAGKRRVGGSKSWYEHNYKNFGTEVLQAPWMVRQMESRARIVMAAAKRLSPGPPKSSGTYKNSFVLTSGVRQAKPRGLRAFGRVTNTSGHAMAVEYGWSNTPKYRPLGNALSAIEGHIGDGG